LSSEISPRESTDDRYRKRGKSVENVINCPKKSHQRMSWRPGPRAKKKKKKNNNQKEKRP